MAIPASPADGNGSVPEAVADEELIRRIQTGDEDSFRILFERHEAALRGRIRQALPQGLRRKVSASDLLQETRIVALRRCIEFHTLPDGTFKGWLLRIVQNKVKDAIRQYRGTAKRGARGEVERGARPETGEFLAEEPSPSEHAMASELREKIQNAMSALPEAHREVLRLTRMEHLSLVEAAKRMGRSPDATRKLYGRALAKFTEVYEARGGSRP